MNADLELYRVFCEVVKYKNISKTAEAMFISQSAITQSIQKLESLLGGKVFYRNKNGVELTEEGKNLYEYVKDSVETMNNAENIFSKYTSLDKGRIRIGGGNSIIAYLIYDSLLEFIKKYPNIDISVESGRTEDLMQKLANGELDLIVLNLPFNDKKYSNIEITPLKKSSYCFFATKKYLKKHPVKNIKELENCTMILPKTSSSKKKIFDEICEKEKLKLNSNYEVSSSSIMKKMVMDDIGVGFTNIGNISSLGDSVDIVKKIDLKDANEGIATLKKNMSSRATVELVELIKKYYKI